MLGPWPRAVQADPPGSRGESSFTPEPLRARFRRPMTFYEAALEVLRREGAPLHFQRITELALDDNLLSHVGRMPEAIMQARLVAMARRAEDRQVVVVEPGVFALTGWGVEHDDDAAEQTAPRPPEAGTPLRRNERIPITLQDAKAVRDAEQSGKFDAEDREARQRGRRRRYQPKADASPVDVLEGLLTRGGGRAHRPRLPGRGRRGARRPPRGRPRRPRGLPGRGRAGERPSGGGGWGAPLPPRGRPHRPGPRAIPRARRRGAGALREGRASPPASRGRLRRRQGP